MTTPIWWYLEPTAPPPPPPRIRLAPGVSGPTGCPIQVRLASADTPRGLTTKVYTLPDLRHPTAVLTQCRGRKGTIRLNESGDGELVLPNLGQLDEFGDGIGAAERALLECGHVVLDSFDGEPVWSWVIGPSSSRTIRDSAHQQFTTYTGNGLLSLLDKAPVIPSNGIAAKPKQFDRLFSWPAPQYRDHTWRFATELIKVGDSPDVWPLTFGGTGDHQFPDRAAWIIGPHTGTTNTAPIGSCYYRHKITLASAKHVTFYAAGDNVFDLYVDGLKLLHGDDLRLTGAVTIDLSAGEHTIAAWVFSGAQLAPTPPTENNPLGLAVAWYEADNSGQPLSETPLGHTDANWRILEYPPVVPGMTPGEAIRLVVAEAQALGALVGWVCDFDHEVDSNGTPWPIAPDLSTKVGYSLETFIAELVETYIDVRASIGGLVLHAYVQDQLGEARPDFAMIPPTDRADPMSGNLQELTHDRTPRTASALLIEAHDTWVIVDDTPGGETVEFATLGLGSYESGSEVERIGHGQLKRYGRNRDAIIARYRPRTAAELPHKARAWVGDTIPVLEWDGTTAQERIKSWGYAEDDQGKLDWTPELADVIKSADERALAAIMKNANGTLSGDSAVAQPISSTGVQTPGCCNPIPDDGPGGG